MTHPSPDPRTPRTAMSWMELARVCLLAEVLGRVSLISTLGGIALTMSSYGLTDAEPSERRDG
jgi:hypothetical protein